MSTTPSGSTAKFLGDTSFRIPSGCYPYSSTVKTHHHDALYRTGSPSPLIPIELEVHTFELRENEEKAFIDYKSDPRFYDSGHRMTLSYRRNNDEPDAIENKIIDSSDETDDKASAVLDVVHELLPTIPHFYPTITGITLKTIGGKITATFGEDVVAIIQYLPIPSHLSHIPTAPINELQKVSNLGFWEERVVWKGETYVFKMIIGNLQDTLRQLTVLDKLSGSPHIVNVEAIVTNRDSDTVRGFLAPFMSSGDLEGAFYIARQTQRLSWARQITCGVVDLHSLSVYKGDLAPKNVHIASGQVVLDLTAIGFSPEFVAPEVLEEYGDDISESGSELTASGDVYSLGLLLYVVAEEKCEDIDPTKWHDGRTCAWYKEIVKRCLVSDPEARPSAAEVLSLLEKGEVLG
ncbi:hypothetical protein BS47DRAFT_1486664 [Hydnum rufescens UP504]|uniref:Protein kinase domain-containing protein n=1 Tax=Hydnum rufescens UP504 TaxID=1448309 RepID=A0A9P6AU48_9AGAM|nr:hypothetical protein BS47DRAFT_1486664 [Hydnum rufescens UP504]